MSPNSEARSRVLLAVTGGVAAFKAVLLLRLLQQAGYDVRVIATPSALKFVGEATFHALSRHPVHHDLWSPGDGAGELHVELARDAAAMVVYPATTRVVGSLAAGITDDLVTLTASCMRGPVVLCPAMHTAMANWDLHIEAKANVPNLVKWYKQSCIPCKVAQSSIVRARGLENRPFGRCLS